MTTGTLPARAAQISGASRILTVSALADVRTRASRKGRTVGLCHGCFDILHQGHVSYLTQAAQQCDVLVVSLTAAAHVNKGPGRPVFGDSARAEVLAALAVVDVVVVNDDATATPVLRILRPDFYFKGAEYGRTDDPRVRAEVAELERHGGQFVLTDGAIFDSSTRAVRVLQGAS